MSISVPKVHLRTRPSGANASRTYLITGDIVGVSRQHGDWLYVQYISDQGRSSSGWIPEQSATLLRPPQ
jgi:hypothetical protein